MEDNSKQRLLYEHDEAEQVFPSNISGGRSVAALRAREAILIVLLVLSLAANAVLSLHSFAEKETKECHEFSPYAGLRERVHGKKYWHDTIYANSSNDTFRDRLWDDIDIDRSVIALDHDKAALLGLPRSQNFVWDETKGIYIINAYHQLHCIKTLYQVITEANRGQKMSFEYLHLTHCLDSLRQEAECLADDSLLYSVDGDVIPVGEGQTLQCRDFAKLDAWALDHHACYTFHNLKPPYFSDGPEKYMNCHKDSEFFPKMREFLGHSEEWQPDYFVNFGPEFPDITSEEEN